MLMAISAEMAVGQEWQQQICCHSAVSFFQLPSPKHSESTESGANAPRDI